MPCSQPADLGLTSPSTTALTDRLESAGHVRRERSPRGRRKVGIRVSEEAIAPGWTLFGPVLTGMARSMRPFGSGELDTVERFLREVAAATRWQEHPAQGEAVRGISVP